MQGEQNHPESKTVPAELLKRVFCLLSILGKKIACLGIYYNMKDSVDFFADGSDSRPPSLSTYHVLATLFLYCVSGGRDTRSPHLLSYKMAHVFRVASAPLGIELSREQTIKHSRRSQILLNVQ